MLKFVLKKFDRKHLFNDFNLKEGFKVWILEK